MVCSIEIFKVTHSSDITSQENLGPRFARNSSCQIAHFRISFYLVIGLLPELRSFQFGKPTICKPFLVFELSRMTMDSTEILLVLTRPEGLDGSEIEEVPKFQLIPELRLMLTHLDQITKDFLIIFKSLLEKKTKEEKYISQTTIFARKWSLSVSRCERNLMYAILNCSSETPRLTHHLIRSSSISIKSLINRCESTRNFVIKCGKLFYTESSLRHSLGAVRCRSSPVHDHGSGCSGLHLHVCRISGSHHREAAQCPQ